MLALEWNEAKRASNIQKHGLDFVDAEELFEQPHLVRMARIVAGEPRWLAIGMIGDICVAAVYTNRDAAIIRLISLRKARDEERRAYHHHVGRGSA